MKTETWFRISLAQWSLHRTIRGGELDCMDFPAHAHDRFGVKAVEYVNSFYGDQPRRPRIPRPTASSGPRTPRPRVC